MIDTKLIPKLGDLPIVVKVENFEFQETKELPTDEELEFFEKEWRGMILASAVCIEKWLDSIILSIFFNEEKNKEKRMFFKESILDKEFFTFEAKKRLLISFAKINKIYAQEDKIFFKKIDDAIGWRNSFAHNSIIIKDYELFLIDSNKKKRQISNELANEITEIFKYIEKNMNAIETKFIKKND